MARPDSKRTGHFIFLKATVSKRGRVQFIADHVKWDQETETNKRQRRKKFGPGDFSLWWNAQAVMGWRIVP